MDTTNLTKFYDDLKSGQNPGSTVNTIRVGGNPIGGISQTPGALAWRTKAGHECEKLKDTCRKQILLDIYCKVLPLDNDFVDGHHAQMQGDVDNMLSSKGMTATKYLTSCFESTKAPLVEFILRATENIGKGFMEAADETLKDAQENDISIPEPQANADSKEIEDQLVDVQSDSEYETFIDKLKEKTISKIVNDVSKIINNKKEEKDMTFDPQPISDVEATTESTVSVGINYLERKLMQENVNTTPEMQEDIIGLAIREATLNMIDETFKQPESDFRNFSSRIRLNRGVIINESTVNVIMESANQ